MCAERTFDLLSVYYLGTGPALWCTQNDHWPDWTLRIVVFTGILLNGFDLFDDGVHGFCHLLVHGHRIVAFYKIWLPAAAFKEAFNLLMRDTGEDGGIADLVAVQVQDRQYRTVCYRIQELIGMPGSSKRTGFCFAVSHNYSGDQIRVVKNCSEGMGDRISQLTAFVDGAWCLRRTVAWHAAGERELFEHFFHSFLVTADIRIYFAVTSVKISICDQEVSAMSGTGEENHVQVITFDYTVAVNIYEILSGYSSPVAYDLLFDLIHSKGFFQQRIVQQI